MGAARRPVAAQRTQRRRPQVRVQRPHAGVRAVQHVGGADSVARRITEAAAAENRRYDGPLGSVGLVVGATVGSALTALDLDLAAVRGPILAPGLGAQGATAADLRRTFGAAYSQVLGTSSRDILGAGPQLQSLRDAARRTLDELLAA